MRTRYCTCIILLMLVACETAPTTGTPRTAPETSPPPPTLVAPTPAIEGDVAGAQVILSFITAFNAGQFDAAYQLLDEDYIVVSDCDWQSGVGIDLPHFPSINRPKSKQLTVEVAEWLRQRMADHDHLFVSRVSGGTLQPRAFGVDFARRTSDTLRRLGFPNGITRILGAKVILSDDHMHISGFAMGPGPLSEHSPDCRPENR